jgi:predicted GNAT family acetyltransferase
VAMAGERLRPPGWSEISSVCTDVSVRRQGLARRLVLALAARIGRRGDVPFLHVEATNTSAIRLYESLGFVARDRVRLRVVCVPDARRDLDTPRTS